MGLLNGQYWGDVKGKVGGAVFGRTKAGKTIRQRVKPTNANTEQQKVTRSTFGSVMSSWGGLSTSLKQGWNTFAVTLFRPKHKKKGNRASGAQAFASSNMILAKSYDAIGIALFDPTTITATMKDIARFSVTAPVINFSPYIQTSTGDPLSLSLNSCALNLTTGKIHLDMHLSPNPQAAAPVFENPVTDEPVAFAIYASGPVGSGTFRVTSDEAYLLATIKPVDVISGWTSSDKVVFDVTIPSTYLSKLKQGFTDGQETQFTVRAVSSTGHSVRIGSIKGAISV
jgi:hypothetical protein